MWIIMLVVAVILSLYILRDIMERASNYDPVGGQIAFLFFIWMVVLGIQ